MYLLLARHLEVFRLAQTMVLTDKEFWDAGDSVMWVNDAAMYRMRDMRGHLMPLCWIRLLTTSLDLFKQRRLELDTEFQKFSYGVVSPSLVAIGTALIILVILL